MRSALSRWIISRLLRLYPREHGKYSLLMRLYFPWFAPRTPTTVIARLSFGLIMKLDLKEYLQAHLYCFGSYELPTVRFIRSFLRANDVVIDVGAQMGYLTLVAATSANKETLVISFEPESNNADRLRENLALNNLSNVTIEQCALSDVDGSLKLYLSKDINAGTHSTVYVEQNVSTSFIEIPAKQLDTILTSGVIPNDRVDLMKIDVEGAEINVLRGSMTTLGTCKPVIVIELSDALQNARGGSAKDIIEFFASLNFEPYTICDDGSLRASIGSTYSGTENVVFAHPDRRERLRPLIQQ